MKIEKGTKVKLEYSLTLQGNVIESSEDKGPLEYTHGSGDIPLADLEAQLEGLEQGEEKEGHFPLPGEHPTQELPKSNFPKDAKFEPGQPFEAKRSDGTPVFFKIVSTTDDKVTVEIVPHLFFKVKVLEVAKA